MKKFVIHPFVFGLYPVFSLMVLNRGKLLIYEAYLSLIIIIIITSLLWIFLHSRVKNLHKSGFLVSAFMIIFLSFGHIYNLILILLGKVGAFGAFKWIQATNLSALILFFFCIIFFLFIYYLVKKTKSELILFSVFLNLVAVSLTLLFVVDGLFANKIMVRSEIINYMEGWNSKVSNLQVGQNYDDIRSFPDIYYIILDGYGREDVLNNYYKIDNSHFYTYLRDHGYYFAEESFANYSQTSLSLASSLNYTYLDELLEELRKDYQSRLILRNAIENNHLINHLRGHGYLIRVISPLFSFYNFSGTADLNLSPRFSLNSIENELINATPIPLLLELPFIPNQYDVHRTRITFSFENISNDIKSEQPVFTFVHILAPHPPFVFDRDGHHIQPNRSFNIFDGDDFMVFASQDEYIIGYRDQIMHITSLLQDSLDNIKSSKEDAPIIIIQADHGPGSMLDWRKIENTNFVERMAILQVYYFPDGDYSLLYPGISPVNSFRVVLNKYFGMDLEYLDDRSYYSSVYDPYRFYDVTEELVQIP